MKSRFKYIIYNDGTFEMPILFSVLTEHQTIANKFGHVKIVSAGFVSIEALDAVSNRFRFNCFRFCCFGESNGLRIKSRGNIDSEIIFNTYQTGLPIK